MTLSDSIRKTMTSQALGPNDFFKRVGIARSTLFNLLAGGSPDLRTLRKLRAAGVRIPKDLLSAA